MTSGYVTFALGERTYAAPLDDVREIVRLSGLTALPSMRPPLAGLLDLRGNPLPVLDVRATNGGRAEHTRGDVLVVDDGSGGCVGIAVDAVHAVLGVTDLSAADGSLSAVPAYVVGVLRGADGAVLLVDLQRLVGAQT